MGRDPDDKLAEIPAFQQADEGFRRTVQAIDDILPVAQTTVRDPRGDVAVEGRALVQKLALDEAAKEKALGQDVAHQMRQAVRPRERVAGMIILGNEAADRNAREVVEQRKHRIPDLAADILEIDVYALRAGRGKLRGKVRRLMIDDREIGSAACRERGGRYVE